MNKYMIASIAIGHYNKRHADTSMPMRSFFRDFSLQTKGVLHSFVLGFKERDERQKKEKQSGGIQGASQEDAFFSPARIQHNSRVGAKKFRGINSMPKVSTPWVEGQIHQLGEYHRHL